MFPFVYLLGEILVSSLENFEIFSLLVVNVVLRQFFGCFADVVVCWGFALIQERADYLRLLLPRLSPSVGLFDIMP